MVLDDPFSSVLLAATVAPRGAARRARPAWPVRPLVWPVRSLVWSAWVGPADPGG
jgi:hypothetical protein